MSYQSKMEEYRNEHKRRRNRMLLILKITVIALAASILLTGVVFGVMLATGGFSSRGETEEEGENDTGASIRGPEGDYVVIYIGDTGVSYKSFVKTTGGATLQVDASDVNLKAAGTYTVHYTLGDLTYDLTVYVRQRTFSESDRKKLYEDIAAKASSLGITDSMSTVEKINKVWTYVSDKQTIDFTDRSNIASSHGTAYSRNTWRTDWEEEAALVLKSKEGDCYSFYSLSKAFFEYLKIENMGIQRSESSTEPGTHFWNLVKLDNGAWYYYDATRLKGSFGQGNRVLMTEAKLRSYVTSEGGTEFYKFDKWNGFPTIATKEVG